ncbi:MAG: STAS domain-containing protein [Syntrophales bacterium]
MKTSIMQLGHYTVITLKEPLNHQNCKELETSVLDVIGKSRLAIILECKEVSYIDSAALEMLLRLQDAIKERGILMKLVGLDELCRDIMVVTRLINQFNVYSSVPEAMKEPS